MQVAAKTVSTRVIVASVVGSAIEWFDYFLYGTLASLVFSKLFFPASDPAISLLLAYLSFSLTFFVRPLGGAFFAFIGDRVGRKRTLVLTLSLMGGATVLIGLLPTYAQVGILAPIALVILRLVQGLGIGGEWGGALLLAYEYAPAERKGLFGSLPQTGPAIGMLLSTLCVTAISFLPNDDFLRWGWRIPFVLSAGLVLVGLWIRRGVDETPEFKAMKAAHTDVKNPLSETLRHHWRAVLTAVCAKFVETGPFYIFTVFVVGYATSTLGLSRLNVLNAVMASAVLSAMVIPCAGWLSDKVGRRTMFLFGCLAMAAFAVPYYLLLDLRTPLALLVATAIGFGLIYPMLGSVLGTLFSEIFATEVRYTGVSLGYQIGAALAGGSAPLIATWLLTRYHGHWGAVAAYIAATAVISGSAILFGARSKA
jgi:metabolite-proton symporter